VWGRRLHRPSFASRGRNSSLEPSHALDIIGEVRHPNLDSGAIDADRAHHQTHAVLLPREDTLDGGADRGPSRVGACDTLAMRLALVDVAGDHALSQQRLVLLGTIGGVGPDARGRVLRASQYRQP